MMQVFQDINKRLFPNPQPQQQPEYKVTTDTPRQVSEIKNQNNVVIVTVHTQNHIQVETWLCHLLNAKK